MTIKDCPNCGGTHYGAIKCPYIRGLCVVCGDSTVWACADCGIDSHGEATINVCEKPECRDEHEEMCGHVTI